MLPFHPSLADAKVTALAGSDASLWVGTIDRGLLHWNAGAVESIDDALPDKQVLSLAIDGATVYAGTALGVAEIRTGRVGDRPHPIDPDPGDVLKAGRTLTHCKSAFLEIIHNL